MRGYPWRMLRYPLVLCDPDICEGYDRQFFPSDAPFDALNCVNWCRWPTRQSTIRRSAANFRAASI